MAMRLSGTMYADQGVAVSALVQQREVELERGSPIALGDDARAWRNHRRECRRQLRAEAARLAVWGIEEDQIVLTRGPACPLEVVERPRAANFGAQPQCRDVARDRPDRGRGRV